MRDYPFLDNTLGSELAYEGLAYEEGRVSCSSNYCLCYVYQVYGVERGRMLQSIHGTLINLI